MRSKADSLWWWVGFLIAVAVLIVGTLWLMEGAR